MTTENILVLSILALSVILFITNKIRADVVSMLVIAGLILTRLLTVEEAFSGFSNPAVITVWSVFIVSGGITRSGIGDRIAQMLLRLAGNNQARLTIVIMLVVGLLSSFMNNIGALAILLPAVISISRKMKTSPSKLLIPLAWASLMGGNMTLIGTPPNILASGLLETYSNLKPFQFFDFLPTGIIVFTTGILYMVLIGRHLLPERAPGGELTDSYPVNSFLTEMRITEKSPLIGKTIQEANLEELYNVNIIHLHPCCEDFKFVLPTSDHRLQVNDELHIEATAESILSIGKILSLETVPDHDMTTSPDMPKDQEINLSEITLSPNSNLVGKSINEIDFRSRYQVAALAVRHREKTLFSHLGDIPLNFGDSILVQGSAGKINAIRKDRHFLLLDFPMVETRLNHKAPIAIAILTGVLILAISGLLSISAAMFIGAILMVLGGVLNIEEAYQSIEWKAVFLIAGMLPLGLAMGSSGTALLLSNQIISAVGKFGPLAILAAIFIFTSLLTTVTANAAATVLAVPIAISVAIGLGADPHPFVMAVIISASTSYLMPFSHPVNVLIYGPGGYHFSDYFKVGIWLSLLILIVTVIFLPIIWPLFP
jgi:di/tricarboxylate transporter